MPNIRRASAKLIKEQVKALGDGVVEVIVATNSRDRHGEILDINGLDTSGYSGVILYGHDMGALPIGKSLGLTKSFDGKQLTSRAQLAVDEYPFAATCYKLIEGGYLTDASIGFIPKAFDAETDTWTQSEMVEFSFVSIGANADAKVTQKALDSVGLTLEAFNKQAKEFIKKSHANLEKVEKIAKTAVIVKGPVADELNSQAKYEYMEDFWEVVYAFCDAYYDGDIKAEQFNALLTETIGILQTIVDGTYAFEDEDDSEDSPVLMSLKKGVTSEQLMKLGLSDKKLDVILSTGNNIFRHLDTMKSLISATESELKAADQDTEGDLSQTKSVRKTVRLVRAKKTLNTVDRIAELAIGELKNQLKE